MLFGLSSSAEDIPKVTHERAICSCSPIEGAKSATNEFFYVFNVWNYTELVQTITARLICDMV